MFMSRRYYDSWNGRQRCKQAQTSRGVFFFYRVFFCILTNNLHSISSYVRGLKVLG